MQMQRRRFLGSAVAVGSAAAAGCAERARAQDRQDEDGQDGPRSEGRPDPPSVPVEESAGGWEVDSERSGFFTDSAGGVTTKGTTVAYVDEALAEEVREKTFGAPVDDLRIFFASRIEYDPPIDGLPFGIGRQLLVSSTAENARERFESQLQEHGLEGVEHRETDAVRTTDGSLADLFVYDASYPFEGFEFEAAGSTFDVDGQAIAVEGLLAVWYSRPTGSTIVAGAINPAENYEETATRELTSAIELTLDIDLGLQPDTYREGSLDLVRSVS